MDSLPVSQEELGTIFGEPTEIGRYALDGARKIVFEPFPLKYLAMPTSECVNLDLNLGYYEDRIKYSGENEGLENLLKWILKNQEKMSLVYGRLGPDFICRRGLLKYVMCTPYLTRLEDWVICASKHRGTIYMAAYDSERETLRKNNLTEMEHLMCFWGYKFEQHLTSDQPGGKPNTGDPVNENNEYYSVIRRQIGRHSVVYAAEVDAIDANYLERNPERTTKSHVELKITSKPENSFQFYTLERYKYIKWWTQSYLADVQKIVVGYRDSNGLVRTLMSHKIEELPHTANAHRYWSSEACMSFCESFLSFVSSTVSEDDPRVVYKFQWEPGEDVTCVRLTNPGIYQVLPDWFITRNQNK